MYNTLNPLEFDTSRIFRKSFSALVILTIAIGFWISLAPIESAVVTQAFVRAKTANRPVQHLGGGKIEQMHVVAGQTVAKGEPLLTLETTDEKSALDAALRQQLGLRISQDTSNSLLNETSDLQFSPGTLALADQLGRNELIDQATLSYRQTLETLSREKQLLNSRRLQIASGREALLSQLKTYRSEQEIIRSQVSSLQKLSDRKLVADFKLDEIRQSAIRLQGAIDAQENLIEEKNNAWEQLDLEESLLVAKARENAIRLREEAESKSPMIESRINRLQHQLNNATLRSSEEGVITQLVVHSAGTTIAAGETLMTILPSAEALIIEARLDTTDIEQVFPGQQARLRLSAFNPRWATVMDAQVTAISADRMEDHDGYYYQVEIQLSAEDLQQNPDMYLAAGMPVEAFLITSKRTVIEYLWAPVSRGLYRAMRET